jgi:hypothetical protein
MVPVVRNSNGPGLKRLQDIYSFGHEAEAGASLTTFRTIGIDSQDLNVARQ